VLWSNVSENFSYMLERVSGCYSNIGNGARLVETRLAKAAA
jgi:hypothetical protein